MRKLSLAALLLGIACGTSTNSPAPVTPATTPATPAASDAASPYGFTVQEEARILALEDRRAYDPALVAQWVAHPNPLHRLRIALALARIGPHAFVDENKNGTREASETQAGVTELGTLAHDADRNVREMAAFALGEIGDEHGLGTIEYLTGDPDAGVAAEAVEALSKVAPSDTTGLRLQRYLWLADEKTHEGVRARAIRFLFRFDNEQASGAALHALDSPSPAIRQEGAYALARRAYAPARAQLELLLTDANVLTRAYAATALGRIGDPASARALITALGDEHPWVRTNAAVAIGRLAEKHKEILNANDLPRVFATLDDADPGVRASMIEPLAAYAEMNETAKARLGEVLKNGSQWERELAAGAFAKHFIKTLDDLHFVSDFHSWSAVRAIEATENSGAIGTEVRAVYFNDQEPFVRAAAIGAIGEQFIDVEAPHIVKAMDDPDVIVRATAISKYPLLTKVQAGRWLATLHAIEQRERTAPQNDARLAAIEAIAGFQHPDRRKFLIGLLADNDPVVRRFASDQLVEQEHLPRMAYTPLPIQRAQNEYEDIVRWSRQQHTATIHMTRGVIQLALLTQDAPMTTWNFAQLAKKKYFDRTSFMRVVPNFVIQGGDPRNDMSGGPGYAIRDEINLQKYTRGAVGMALSGPDTGGSQFFITHSPQPHLDGGYTIFARVYEGMTGVVDQTERGDRVETITIDEHPPVTADAVASVEAPRTQPRMQQ